MQVFCIESGYELKPYEFMSQPHIRSRFRGRTLMIVCILDFIFICNRKIGVDGIIRAVRRKWGPLSTSLDVSNVIYLLNELQIILIDDNNYVTLQPEKMREFCHKSKRVKEYKSKRGRKTQKVEKKRQTETPVSPPALHLAGLFIDHVIGRYPHKKPSDFNKSKWGALIDIVSRRSRLPIPELQKVLEWAFKDSFWASVTLSPGELLKRKEAGGATKLEKIMASMHKTPGSSKRDTRQISTPEEHADNSWEKEL